MKIRMEFVTDLPPRTSLSGGIYKSGLVRPPFRAAPVENDTPGHAWVVARYALLLAHNLGVTDEFFLRERQRGAHLHDIGKAGIPRSVLCKVCPLTAPGRSLDH